VAAILRAGYRPRVLVVEVNAKLGPSVAATVPYAADGSWDGTDYHGGSVEAMRSLGAGLGYTLIYCESCGVNCFLVRDDVLGLNAMSAKDAASVRSELRSEALHRPQRFHGHEGWQHPPDGRERRFVQLAADGSVAASLLRP